MSTAFIVLSIVSALIALPTVYLGVTALFLFKHRTRYPHAEAVNRYAVVVPARNEAAVLPNLVRFLRAQDYPADRFDIVVAANNCTDSTETLAAELGCRVIHCEDTHCKGDVLHQTIDILMRESYDAFVFFDADNLPEKDFLSRVNDAMAAGETVCKGRLMSGNAAESWVSGSYGLYHMLMEWTYSRPHTNMGTSSNLVGTAFAVHRSVFEKMHGWNTKTMCEDSEFAAQCSSIGERVAFLYDAVSYDEQVTGFWISLIQRRRWCRGMIDTARLLTRELLTGEHPKKFVSFDFGMLLVLSHAAPLSFLLMIVMLFFMPKELLLLQALGLAASYGGMVIAGPFLCRFGGYPLKGMWKTILLYPVFMASWMPLQAISLFVPIRQWKPIVHKGQNAVTKITDSNV